MPQSPIMTLMIRAAEKAGRALVRDFGEVEQLQVSRKGPADFVTAADKRSEQIIYEELQKGHPDYSFLMEESGQVKGKDPDNVWIVDPLDGTHNFMHGLPHWCISIALERKNEIIAGLVYDPVKDEMFQAEKGTGASVRNKRLRVSGRNQLEACTIGFGNPTLDPAKKSQLVKELDKVSEVSPMIRRYAAAALDLAYVAAGRLDGYWERGLKPWDAAAGVLLVKESGGFVSSIQNNDNPVYSGNIVAGNPSVHEDLKKILLSEIGRAHV